MLGRMPPALVYPDLQPPAGWTWRPDGSQIRLSPPPGAPPGLILLSPVVAVSERLPPPERLLELALGLEEETRFTVTRRAAPRPVSSDTGLRGVCLEVGGYARPDGPPERRIYVLYTDERCCYGINYVAPEATFETHLSAFWAAAGSLRPYSGAVDAPAAGAKGPSPMSNYED